MAAAADTTRDRLEGEVVFESLVAQGPNQVTTQSALALNWLSEEGGASIGWGITAEELVVHTTRRGYTGYAWSPASDGQTLASTPHDEETTEREFANVTVSFTSVPSESSLLAVGESGAMAASLSNPSEMMVGPSRTEYWKAGPAASDSESSGTAFELQGVFEVTEGVPTLRSEAAEQSVVEGDFSLYVWGPSIRADAEDGTAEYRSGSWTSNSVGDTGFAGASREEHSQLLRLDITNGRFSIAQWVGDVRLAAPQSTVVLDGSVLFANADAHLASSDYLFDAEHDPVAVTGSMVLGISRGVSDDRLLCSVAADSAETTLPPSAERFDGSSGTAKLLGSKLDAFSVPPISTSATQSAAGVLVVLAVLMIVVAGAWFLLRRRARDADSNAIVGTPGLLARAEQLLVDGKPARARAVLKPLLSASPPVVDAWFVHGASLVQEGLFRQAIEDLSPVASKTGRDGAGLSFLVCLSFLRLRQTRKAGKWAVAAAVQPDFLAQMQLDETFASVRRHLPAPPSIPTAAPMVMPAPKPSVDVAYG